MKKPARYDIIVFSDQHTKQRQFNLSKRTLILSATGIIAGFSALLLLGFYMANGASKEGKLEEAYQQLQKENSELMLANERYLEASVNMEKRLNQFEEKATRLSTMVGVEASFQDGIGGPDLLDNELNQYLRYDLGLLEQRTELLEAHFDSLEEAFTTKSDLLEATPSILPARGWLSSGFKYRIDPFTNKRTWHNGLDISGPKGTPVYAPAKGIIIYRGKQGGFGNLIEISHGNGLKTRYAHLDKFNVSKGQRVKRGDLIGYMGDSGRSTAPHLHYEIHKDGKGINPMKYIIRDVKGL